MCEIAVGAWLAIVRQAEVEMDGMDDSVGSLVLERDGLLERNGFTHTASWHIRRKASVVRDTKSTKQPAKPFRPTYYNSAFEKKAFLRMRQEAVHMSLDGRQNVILRKRSIS